MKFVFQRLAIPITLLVVVALLIRCGGSGSTNSSTNTGSPGSAGTTNTPAVPVFSRVAIVVLENAAYGDIIGNPNMPFLNGLAQQYSLATNFNANTHPSIGNYFMMTTGQIVTNDSAFSGTVSADNVVRQLNAAGKSWKVYAQSIPSAGYLGDNSGAYLKRHNPFVYFSDMANSAAQAANVVSSDNLSSDIQAGNLANYLFIVPDAQHDMHDCPSGMTTCTLNDKAVVADNWLRANIGLLMSSSFAQDGLLILTFDESIDADTAGGGGHIVTILAGANVKRGFQSTTFLQHQSILRLSLEALGLHSIPGAGTTAQSMAEFF